MVERRASGAFSDRRLAWLLLLVLVPWYARGLASDGLTHGDEAYWISAGTRIARLLREGELGAPEWQTGATASVLDVHHPTETAANRNPKLGALLIGASVLWLEAPVPRRWAKDYAFHESPEWNRRHGLLPARATLLAGRLPVAALALWAALWFFRILRTQVGPGFAFAGTLLLATSPLVSVLCRRAMLDGPAYALSIGAVLCAIHACRAPERWGPMLATGLVACAAVSSKLNAGILLPILGLAFGLEALLRRSPTPLLRAGAAGALALVLFVGLNPTLYVAPWEGLRAMLRLSSEIGGLGTPFGEVALPTLGSRIVAAHGLLLLEKGVVASRLALPVDGLLLAVGVVVLGARARRDAAARVLLLWIGVALLAVCLWPPVRWERYFLPALAPIAAAEAVALGVGLPALVRRLRTR